MNENLLFKKTLGTLLFQDKFTYLIGYYRHKKRVTTLEEPRAICNISIKTNGN